MTESKNGLKLFIKNPYFQYAISPDFTLPYDIKVDVKYFQETIRELDNCLE